MTKRFLTLLLALCLALSATACSSGDPDTAASSSGAGQTADQTETGKAAAQDTASAPDTAAPASSDGEDRTPISPAIPYVDGDPYYEFDFSKELTETGYFTAFDASDYVTLPESLSVPVPYDVHTPGEEAVNEAIDSLLKDYETKEQIVNRAVEEGDTINIDYVGTLNGEAFQGGSTGGYGTDVTVGVTNYVDDFLFKLVGHMPGETFDIDIHFPEDYGTASLAGQDTVFNVTINYIVGEAIRPELTDSFVAENFSSTRGWNTAEELKTAVQTDLADEAVLDHLYNYLLDNSTVKEVPEAMSDYMKNYFIYYHSYLARGNGVTLPQLLDNFGYGSMSDMLTAFDGEIASACEEELVVQAAAKKLGVELTDLDVTDYFTEQFGSGDYSVYEQNFGLPYVKKMILSWKVLKLMQEQATYLEQ